MNRFGKIGVVTAGYLVALLAAAVAVYFRQLHTSGPAAQASAGMFAFGDGLLALAVFGFVALVPTAVGLHFLRDVPKFWGVVSVGALAVAATGPVAAGFMAVASARSGGHTPGAALPSVVALRMFAVPVMLGCDFLLALFAPAQGARAGDSSGPRRSRARRWRSRCCAERLQLRGALDVLVGERESSLNRRG